MTKNKEKKKMANKARKKQAKQRLTGEPKIPVGDEVKHLLSKFRRVPDDAIVKEGFLWELVRNAACALYRVRRESLVDKGKFGNPPELFIHIIADKTDNTLSVIDSGIGMTKDDLENKLGAMDPLSCEFKYMKTVDKYSTPDADDDLFDVYSEDCLLVGVGTFSSYMVSRAGLSFYSAYMVADKVVITTKQAGNNTQYVWELDANKNGAFFTLDARDTSGGGDTLDRGTKVTLHLRDGLDREYLEERKLKELVNKYSKYICPYPISIFVSDENKILKQVVVVDDDGDKEKEEEPRELLEQRYKCIKDLFVKFIEPKMKNVEFVITDSVFDLPCNLSVDGGKPRLEINPNHRDIEKIRKAFVANPKDKDLKYAVLVKFEFCLQIFKEYDEGHGTSFHENALKTLSITDDYIDISPTDEEDKDKCSDCDCD